VVYLLVHIILRLCMEDRGIFKVETRLLQFAFRRRMMDYLV
jgi:hypothetical protein